METITKEQLFTLLVGKKVRITHTGNDQKDLEGEVVDVHVIDIGFDIELSDGQRIGVSPDTLSQDAVEGGLSAVICGRRKFQIIKAN